MKFIKAGKLLKQGKKIAQPSWGDVQYLKLSDVGKIQHFLLRGDKTYFENYVLSYDNIFTDEWTALP